MAGRYIAMWSGPRNISTALMRSWENRADTFVHDEPFYAHYLTHTPHKADHPGADDVIEAYETDWQKVVSILTGPIPEGKTIYYQKHMTHHMLDHIDLGWLSQVTNCFLIRDPRQVINSFAKVIPNPQVDQIGLPRQWELFQAVREQTGQTPPVIDSNDVLRNPKSVLSQLCEQIDLPFDEAMLQWAPGRRATDGNWAPYWYRAVEQSTGFQPYEPDERPVPAHLEAILEASKSYYEAMAEHRIMP